MLNRTLGAIALIAVLGSVTFSFAQVKTPPPDTTSAPDGLAPKFIVLDEGTVPAQTKDGWAAKAWTIDATGYSEIRIVANGQAAERGAKLGAAPKGVVRYIFQRKAGVDWRNVANYNLEPAAAPLNLAIGGECRIPLFGPYAKVSIAYSGIETNAMSIEATAYLIP